MSSTSTTPTSQSGIARIVLSSVVGTAIEWYDFFLYATASALIFNHLFFPDFDPTAGTIAAFGTFAVGYVARPIGAIAFGHLGDRVGRKSALVTTLMIMGVCTCIIGLLPTYASIGVWAPVLLIALRFCQGLAVGGEWGGAVLIVVESAPADRRGFYGAFPQIGVPIGLIVSTFVFKLVASLPEAQFLSWGWRVPFLLSIALVAIGLFIRLNVDESPAFAALRAEDGVAKSPLIELLRDNGRNVLLALGTRFATDITFNIINVFVLAYAVQTLGIDRGMMLNAIIAGSCVALVTIPLFGRLSDAIGRRTVFLGGCVFVAIYGFAFFWLLGTQQTWLVILAYVGGAAVSQPCVYGVQSTWFAEIFGTRVRYTGASLPYQVAGILTSAPTPLIAALLYSQFGSTLPIAGYIAATAAISFLCALCLAETYRRPLT